MRPRQRRRDLGPHLSDPTAFIRERLTLQPVQALPDIRLYTAHAGSRLSQLDTGDAPYWAYVWSGGAVLARYLLDHPQTVAGKRVLDFGCGSGVVAMAAARAGATTMLATDVDEFARAAAHLNAAANEVDIDVLAPGEPPPPVDLVLAGDVFYNADVASRTIASLDAFRAVGTSVLVGDPGRRDLPAHLLAELARYDVAEFGSGGAEITAAVYAYRP